MNATQVLVACSVLAFAGARPAAAEPILFSSFGPGNAYNVGTSSFFGFDYGVEGDPDSRFARAMSFVSGGTAPLGAVELALQFPFSFTDGTLKVNLFAAEGQLPGELLEGFTGTDAQRGTGIFRFDSVRHPELMAGQTYFLEATTDGLADGLWFFSLNSPGRVPDVYRNNGGPWFMGEKDFNTAFRVTAADAVTPEPASLVLLATGLLCALARRRFPGSRVS